MCSIIIYNKRWHRRSFVYWAILCMIVGTTTAVFVASIGLILRNCEYLKIKRAGQEKDRKQVTGIMIGNESEYKGEKDLNIDKLAKLLEEQNQLLRTLIISNSKSDGVRDFSFESIER